MFNIKLNQEETNYILKIMAERPLGECLNLWMNIKQQAEDQVNDTGRSVEPDREESS
jgi:hypothetical protein